MKQLLSIIMALITCCPIYSQVTVGAGTEPQKFSILEIVSNSKGGLRLPQLTADERQTLEDSDEFQAEKESKAKGLMIYNLDTDCVDTWAGNQWLSECRTPPLTISISSNPANGVVILNREVTMTATASGAEPLTYQWKRNGIDIAGATSATHTVNNMSHDDKGSYTCTVSNEAGNAVSNTLPITYICGAMTTSGTFLQFMCHNLGADESLDPLIHDTRLYGDLYQWGRRADGHEKRDSEKIRIEFNEDPRSTFLDANGQVAESSDKYGKLIDGIGYDWRVPSDNTLWGNGTQDENQPKAYNDPCPEGWKIPSMKQWKSLIANIIPNLVADATANTWTWTGNGFMVGDALFLPASGNRTTYDGIQYHNDITYHSTTSKTDSYDLIGCEMYNSEMLRAGVGRAEESGYFENIAGYREYAYPVRCVKE